MVGLVLTMWSPILLLQLIIGRVGDTPHPVLLRRDGSRAFWLALARQLAIIILFALIWFLMMGPTEAGRMLAHWRWPFFVRPN
jgi:hypothetical protein